MNYTIDQLRRLVYIEQGVCRNLQHLKDDRYINGYLIATQTIIDEINKIIEGEHNNEH